MLEFNTVEELRNCKELQNMGRYENKKVKLAGKEVFACTTNQQYEDIIFDAVCDIVTRLNIQFGGRLIDCPEDISTDIRDTVLKLLKEKYGIEFVDVFEDY